jgi:cell wall-associated NlpC family hydrolase
VPAPGWVIAVAVAIQESTLRNLDHRDSLGLFQQRPSQGWGTPEQIMNPTYATTQFYRHLQAVPGWQQVSLNDAAQAVQHSGTPDAYGRHQQTAEAIVAAVTGVGCESSGGDCSNIAAPTPAALTATNYACGQLGLPYVWGGNGPEVTELPNGQSQVRGGFDCSGLTKAAYAAAGIQIPRTAQTQYAAGPRVPAGQSILPGDLVFFGSGPRAVTHVGIAVSARRWSMRRIGAWWFGSSGSGGRTSSARHVPPRRGWADDQRHSRDALAGMLLHTWAICRQSMGAHEETVRLVLQP